jgi:hypothetical protein
VSEFSPRSDPLSGFDCPKQPAPQRFPQVPSSRPFFVPHPFVGSNSFRGFPSQRSRTPLEAAGSPALIRLPAATHRCDLIAPGFFPRPLLESRAARKQNPSEDEQREDSPADYGFPFERLVNSCEFNPRPPGSPGSQQPNHRVQPTSPASKRSSLCESVHARPSCPVRAADPLLERSRLSRTFSVHARGPQTHPNPFSPLHRTPRRELRFPERNSRSEPASADP